MYNKGINMSLKRIFKKTVLLFTMFSMVFALSANAQTKKQIKGTVKDATGMTLPGVSVQEKGTDNGVVTDANGNYTINASSNATLVFSFIGMSSQETVIGGRSTINITLSEDVEALDEVVVTALGIKKDKASLGYAISKVEGAKMLEAGTTVNPIVTLYGKAAGVAVNQGVAGPTGGVNIKIRGAAGLEASAKTRPLFVIDGVPIFDEESSMATRGYNPLNSFDYGSGINDINAEDIESMEILKGAQASVLYGSEGANGVVLITTKNGKGAKGLGVNITYEHTFDKPVSYIKFQNQYGTGRHQYDIRTEEVDGKEVRAIGTDRASFGPKFDGTPVRFYDGTMIPYEAQKDNFMDLFRDGHSDNFSAAISGSGKMGHMRLSFTKKDYQGILDNFTQNKNSFNFNGMIKASDLATFEVTSSLHKIETKNRYPNINGLVSWGVNRDHPFSKLKNWYLTEDGYRRDTEGLSLAPAVGHLSNIWWEQEQNSDVDDKFHYIGSLKTTLKFTKWFSLAMKAGIDYTDIDYTTKNKVIRIEPQIKGGRYSYARRNIQVHTYSAFANFNKNFLDERLKVTGMVGPSYKRVSESNINVATYGDLSYADWYSLNNEKSWPDANDKGKVRGHWRGSNVLYSVLGTSTISLDDKYYLELSGRNDWSSTLPPDNNSYFYPGVGLAWIFTKDFEVPYMNFGKMRLSWADVGKDAPSRYYTFKSWNISKIANTNATSVNGSNSLFAGELKPERKREIEIGFNSKFFKNNRLEFDFSFYSNRVYDQIMSVPLSHTVGASEIKINAGEVKNWGYEMMISGTPILTRDLRWELSLTMANQKSEVVKLYPGITSKTIDGTSGYKIVAEEGKPYGDIKMYDYKVYNSGQKVVDESGFYQLEDKELSTVGNVSPEVLGGLNSDLSYKGFNLHIGIDYKFGGTLFSYSNYYLLGNGLTENTLKYRDEANGGMAYYIDKNTNKRIAVSHNTTAPSNAKDGRVYHDGLVLNGVVEVKDANGNVTGYRKNDKIVSAYEYYSTFLHDMSDGFQPDNLYKNDYIKVREMALSYTLPKKVVKRFNIQNLTLSLTARNLFYLYKTLPNVDAESTLGTNEFKEYSFFPSVRTYGVAVKLSF